RRPHRRFSPPAPSWPCAGMDKNLDRVSRSLASSLRLALLRPSLARSDATGEGLRGSWAGGRLPAHFRDVFRLQTGAAKLLAAKPADPKGSASQGRRRPSIWSAPRLAALFSG